VKHEAYKPYDLRHFDRIPGIDQLPTSTRLEMRAVASVLPFRTNRYVVERLIRWRDVPDDPIFQLVFPQPGMLAPGDLAAMKELLARGASAREVSAAAERIRAAMNPHPAGQKTLNVPRVHGKPASGIQHKYRETVLFFPRQGQTCHAFCTYCFRWPQFVGNPDLRFASDDVSQLVRYLHAHPEANNVLITGGDPMVMKTSLLERYLEPLLAPELDQLSAIRIGSKAATYWPYRFLTDPDADDLLRLFERVAKKRHLAFMAHVTHPRELSTPEAQAAVRRIVSTGAVVRCQAPLIRHVNDSAVAWESMWRAEVALGAIPYYMFVERDTGPKGYFEVPLVRAWNIYRDAVSRVSGLARTVRGPSMSATPGKVVVDGVTHVAGRDVLSLRFIQARLPEWVGRPFFAELDPLATWLDQLRPAFGEPEFFFGPALRELARRTPDEAGRVRLNVVDDEPEAA
jgi:L-lysine 2,3-aminomutase